MSVSIGHWYSIQAELAGCGPSRTSHGRLGAQLVRVERNGAVLVFRYPDPRRVNSGVWQEFSTTPAKCFDVNSTYLNLPIVQMWQLDGPALTPNLLFLGHAYQRYASTEDSQGRRRYIPTTPESIYTFHELEENSWNIQVLINTDTGKILHNTLTATLDLSAAKVGLVPETPWQLLHDALIEAGHNADAATLRRYQIQ